MPYVYIVRYAIILEYEIFSFNERFFILERLRTRLDILENEGGDYWWDKECVEGEEE